MFDVTPLTSRKNFDCGPTCLQMLLKYYNTDVPLSTLTTETNTTPFTGCTAKSIKTAGNAHGLDIRIYPIDADELIQQDRPAIVWWRFNHYVMMCGCDEKGDVVICNPDRGRYRLDKGSFASMYSGVAIFNGVPAALA